MEVVEQPIVIDNGTGVLKAGLAGQEMPKCIMSAVVGRPRHHKVLVSGLESELFVGKSVDEHRGILRLSWPMENGTVTHWSDMERIWEHMYRKELDLPADQHPVLVTEAPLNARRHRERLAEVFFETFGVPAFFVSMQAVLSLYAAGRTTGVVLDVGDGVTHCVPVYEGYAMPHAITRIDVAGRTVTQNLVGHLRRAGYVFHTTAEMEIVRNIKETVCFVSTNPAKDEELSAKAATELADYRLPDGQVLKLGAERFRAPECLFNPALVGLEYVGVHQCIIDSIWKTDVDLRKKFYSEIFLAGGSTMFKGFGERLIQELKKAAPDGRVRITAPPDRKLTTWTGGSILASLSTFKKMWISASEYKEQGMSILHKKTF